MQVLCIVLIAAGAIIMFLSIAKYYKALKELKSKMNTHKLFSDWIYIACFIMMLFFLAGYIINIIVYAMNSKMATQDLLIAGIFFFGAIFVFSMVSMSHRMFITITDKDELKKRLKQQELMSDIALSFTSTADPKKLIYDALKMAGEFINADHVFLSKYEKEDGALECLYEWYDGKAHPFIGRENKWPITSDMQIFNDLTGKGYAAVDDYNLLTHPNFNVVKDYNLRAFLNVSIEMAGKFWGILGFIIYETAHTWNESDIHLGKLIAGIFSGVISRNMADEELVRAKEMAEQGNKSKSEFLSRMSHEMRTPMNTVIGMTNIGKNSPDVDKKNYCFERIEFASTHLLGVINDVLDMSKIEANRFELSFTEFSLEKMLAKVLNVIGYQMEKKKHRFFLSVDADVPKLIFSDEQRLNQVITNLLSNAVKFSPEGGSISLFVRKLREENEKCVLEFEVKDTGIGISEEQQAKLFRSFEQADGSISRKYGGTGLGLAISKRIVELLNGNIRAESEAGCGASFIFNICAQKVEHAGGDEAFAVNDDASAKFGAGCFKGHLILIAEDIDINREIIATLLEFTEIDIDFAEDGKQAYDLFSADPGAYGMIFMDIHMPNVDGYEATKMIRNMENPFAKTIPIIAITADVFREDIEKCLIAGMNSHVGKPLDINDVLTKLSQYLPYVSGRE